MRQFLTCALFFITFSGFCQKTINEIDIAIGVDPYASFGSTWHFNYQLSSGVGIKNQFFIEGNLGYNNTGGLFQETIDTVTLDYYSLGVNFKYRFLEDKQISPLILLATGSGVPAKKSKGTWLSRSGNPELENAGFSIGKFKRVNCYLNAAILLDFEFKNNFNLQYGAGIRFIQYGITPGQLSNYTSVNQKGLLLLLKIYYSIDSFKGE